MKRCLRSLFSSPEQQAQLLSADEADEPGVGPRPRPAAA
jgi:hypothetical protein